MKFITDNEDVYEGETATEVVRKMSGDKLTRSRSLKRYREATAKRVSEVFGLTIDSGDDNLFLKSLIAEGLLRPID